MENKLREEITNKYRGKIIIFESFLGGGNPMQGFDYPEEKEITEDFFKELETLINKHYMRKEKKEYLEVTGETEHGDRVYVDIPLHEIKEYLKTNTDKEVGSL